MSIIYWAFYRLEVIDRLMRLLALGVLSGRVCVTFSGVFVMLEIVISFCEELNCCFECGHATKGTWYSELIISLMEM